MISVNSDSLSLLVRRNINTATSNINTALERMATGYKVNRAKDDAANISISEHLKTQINSAKVLKKGSSMAIDMLSVAEGALIDIDRSLLRIRDLTLQQMNGIYDEKALAAMNDEIQQQISQILQTVEKAEFNGRKLFDGSIADMRIPLYDTTAGLSGLNLDSLFTKPDFVDVFAGVKNLYFIDAKAGETYYADFDGKLFAITSDKDQQVTYNYGGGKIDFVDCTGVKAVELGSLDSSFSSMGNGEQYLQMEANKSYYVKSGNKVFELKNTNSVSQTVVFKNDSSGGLDIISGDGVQKNFLYDIDKYFSIDNGQALELKAGSTQHYIFNNKLYQISSTKNQTFIFNNKNGNLNPLAGNDGVTINIVGNMKQSVTSGLASYIELNPNETKYYEFNGNIYKITNNQSTKQNYIIDANNNVKDANGSIVRTQLLTADLTSLSSYSNFQSMTVVAGNDYYLKNEDGKGITKITAQKDGIIYFDKTSSGYDKFIGADVSVSTISDYEEVSLSSTNQFDITVKAGETKLISINNEIYTINNDTDSDFTKTFIYDGVSKSVEELVTSGIVQLTKDEAIAQGYTIIETAADLDNVRNNTSGKYMLMGNIDLSGYDNWTPLGAFTGIFDGNGYKISNLKIDNELGDDLGLFTSNEGVIKNVGLENVDIKGKNFIGAIAGWNSFGGQITNCYATGSIQGLDCVGGLIGDNYEGDISKSYFSGNVKGSDKTGGIVGVSYNSSISDCFVTGSVGGKAAIGGISGNSVGKNIIKNCYVTAGVNATDSTSVGAITGENDGSVSNSLWDIQKTGLSVAIASGSGSATNNNGFTTIEMSNPQIFINAGWDSDKWDLSSAPPSLNIGTVIPVIGSYVADFSTSVSESSVNKKVLENFTGTAYVKSGNDIFEITNNGQAQDILFDIDAQTGMLAPVNAPDVSVKRMESASFNNLSGSNFSSVINPGESQYMMFTIYGVQRVYKVTNNSADKQSVIYEKGNGVSIVSGDGVVIEEYKDMVRSTGLDNNYFYLDFSSKTTQNVHINGNFYEITNPNASTAVFKINGNDIVQVEGTSATIVSKEESNAIASVVSQYKIELNPNETKYIKIGDFVYELVNNTNTKQTQVFNTNGNTLECVNPNITTKGYDLSNTPMQQMLIKTDWAIQEVLNRRASIGAAQNVLEAAISRNTNLEINLTEAQSTIMDADFAEESANLVRNQILQNVSVSLLSQVSSVKRNVVLSLIGG